jgi:PAS domain S-box-containing protein
MPPSLAANRTLDLPADEAGRIAALRALDILDSQPEAIFDALTKLAALTFAAPVALITLVDVDRQWFKSCVGTDICETPRDVAFCNYTIRSPQVLVVPDAREDPRFRENPLVTGEPHIRFYAGAPLTGPDGHRLGSLCIIDFAPRAEFSAHECAQLEAMASAVSTAMTMRRDLAAFVAMERDLHLAHERLLANEARLAFLTDNSKDVILRVDPDATITWISPSSRHYGYEPEELVGSAARDLVHPDDRALLAERRVSRFAQMADPQGPNLEYRIRAKTGEWIWVEENPAVIRDTSGRAVEIINVLRDISDRKRAERAAGDIQSGMLLPRDALAALSPKVEVDAVLKPARTIGGDLYDAFMVGPERLCFLVGDVTGKGVPAALFMALAKALAHSTLAGAAEALEDGGLEDEDDDLGPSDDLGAAVAAIGAELSRNNSEAMAISLLVGVLDLGTGRLQLVNAGHDDPVLILPDGKVVDLTLEGGPPLCAAEGYVYPVETHQLPQGAALVCVTDGVTEAQGPTGDLFGRKRLRMALGQHAGAPALTEMVDSLVAAVRNFEAKGEPSDDLAVLALRRR